MKTEIPDVMSKTDSELLEIWANQADYVSDMVALARVEIERRHLDTGGVQIRTGDEIRLERETAEFLRYAKVMAFLQGGLGFLLILGAFFSFRYMFFGDPLYRATKPDPTFPLILLVLGVVALVFAIGVGRHEKWAFVAGTLLYSAATLWNLLATGFNIVALFVSRASVFRVTAGDLVIGILRGVVAIILSAYLAKSFNRLRKMNMAHVLKPRHGQPPFH
jgi:hypothetical protein